MFTVSSAVSMKALIEFLGVVSYSWFFAICACSVGLGPYPLQITKTFLNDIICDKRNALFQLLNYCVLLLWNCLLMYLFVIFIHVFIYFCVINAQYSSGQLVPITSKIQSWVLPPRLRQASQPLLKSTCLSTSSTGSAPVLEDNQTKQIWL